LFSWYSDNTMKLFSWYSDNTMKLFSWYSDNTMKLNKKDFHSFPTIPCHSILTIP
jgi:hypothetical protein